MSDDDWDDENAWEDDLDDPCLLRQPSYEVLQESEIQRRQASAIETLADEFGLEYTLSAVLLIQNSWSPQQVMEKIQNSAINLPFLVRQSSKTLNSSDSLSCLMCYKSKTGTDFIAPDCEHAFCISCYTEFLKESVSAGKDCMFTKCPMPDCSVLIPEDLFKRLLPRRLFDRYKMFILRSYVDGRTDVKWCPAPGCSCAAISGPSRNKKEIVCSCGYSWCFGCGKESHRPLSCELLSKWNQRMKADDSEQWLLANTKNCPKCRNAIQKNLGCMHMTCKCGHEFCWLCLGDWQQHGSETGGYYRCNKFSLDQEKGKYAKEEKDRVMAAYSLKRFEHYYNRFIMHKASLKAAEAKRNRIKNYVCFLYSSIRESLVFDFLNQAADLVFNSKRSLAFSYSLGYFLTSPCKIRFYEFIQGSLESSMIQLDELTEKDLNSFLVEENDGSFSLQTDFPNFRMKVVSLAEVVKKYFDECMNEMEAGFPEVMDNDEEGVTEEYLLGLADINISDKWICGACTMANDLGLQQCGACGNRRIL
jgi:ariadne-1